MHHERYGLHLYRRWRVQSCILEVLKNTRVEMILGLKLLKRANRVGHIAAMDVYTVLRTNAIHLKAKPRKKEKKALRSVEFFSWTSNLYKNLFLGVSVRGDLFLMKMLQPLEREFLRPVLLYVWDLSVQGRGTGDAASLGLSQWFTTSWS